MPLKPYEAALIAIMSSHRDKKYFDALKPQQLQTHQKRAKYLKDHGWKPLPTSNELGITAHGYFGVAYYREDPENRGTIEVAFGHRGTCFGLDEDGIGNLMADIEIAEQTSPAILQTAYEYINSVFRNIPLNPNSAGWQLEGRPITRVTHSGFSLGGYIAGACVANSPFDYVYAITFDGPGISPLIRDDPHRARVAPRIINYVATTPNLVNTCNEQIGAVRQLTNVSSAHPKTEVTFTLDLNNLGCAQPARLPPNESVEEFRDWLNSHQDHQNRSVSFNAAMAELTATLNSHNLEAIITSMDNNKKRSNFHKIQSWPSATNTFLYGADPMPSVRLYYLNSTGNFLADLIMNGISLAIQLAKLIAVAKLWQITQVNGIGIIGITHQRSNVIVYEPELTQTPAQLMAQRTDGVLNNNLATTAPAVPSQQPAARLGMR